MLNNAGGEDYVPETKRLLARRVAAFEAELINLKCKFATIRADGGEPKVADLDVYQRMTGAQRRCLEALGWERTARDVTPSLDQYVASKKRREGGVPAGRSLSYRFRGQRRLKARALRL
jgi:hypothetical protein